MSRGWKIVLGSAACVVLLTAGLLAIFQRVAAGFVTNAVGKREETVDLGVVVTRIRDLNRLETATMRIVHISTTSQSYGAVPDAFGGDSLTFMAVGDVIAGIDLSALSRDDLRLEPTGNLLIRIPASQILLTRVDNHGSKVLNRKTGMLRRSDEHMESRARAQAESGIRHEAVKKGILALAQKNAESRLAELMLSAGFKSVRVELRRDAVEVH